MKKVGILSKRISILLVCTFVLILTGCSNSDESKLENEKKITELTAEVAEQKELIDDLMKTLAKDGENEVTKTTLRDIRKSADETMTYYIFEVFQGPTIMLHSDSDIDVETGSKYDVVYTSNLALVSTKLSEE